MKRFSLLCCIVLVLWLSIWLPLDPAAAYIVSPPMTLGKMVTQSTQIIVVKVEKVDQDKNVIVWRASNCSTTT